MIVDLDDQAALDPGTVGPKAAWLARARGSGLPVLPGFAVDATASRPALRLGAEALAGRGSGGARLAVTGVELPFAADLVASAGRLAPALVARSSSTLEDRPEWAGAFTSYLDLAPEEVPTGVVGCWASAFTVDALGRQAAAGIEPGSFPMAVLVQPSLQPRAGGTATIDGDGRVVVDGVAGHPAPLLGGWSGGARTELVDGTWRASSLHAVVGLAVLDELADALRVAAQRLGATRCEWALADRLWILQLGQDAPVDPVPAVVDVDQGAADEVRALALGDLDRAEAPMDRLGRRSWEPLLGAVALGSGDRRQGRPAAPGIGAGLAARITRREDPFIPRRVVVAERPVPFLAPLLWDAAGLATRLGSPAAHVFRSARALGVPAVCGVEIEAGDDLVVAVDGDTGVVATMRLLDA